MTLSAKEEAIVVAVRGHTLLRLDKCLYALQAAISRLSEAEGDKPGPRTRAVVASRRTQDSLAATIRQPPRRSPPHLCDAPRLRP